MKIPRWIYALILCPLGGPMINAQSDIPPPVVPEMPAGPDAETLRSYLSRLEEYREKNRALEAAREAARETIAGPETLSEERERLRARLVSLVRLLEENPPGSTVAFVDPSPSLADLPRPADPIGLARNLFRSGQTAAALEAFRMMDTSRSPARDRAFARYMAACCLRKLDRLDEAEAIYREVIDSGSDEFLIESARWQIRSIQTRRDLTTRTIGTDSEGSRDPS